MEFRKFLESLNPDVSGIKWIDLDSRKVISGPSLSCMASFVFLNDSYEVKFDSFKAKGDEVGDKIGIGWNIVEITFSTVSLNNIF